MSELNKYKILRRFSISKDQPGIWHEYETGVHERKALDFLREKFPNQAIIEGKVYSESNGDQLVDYIYKEMDLRIKR
jgi:hypothetical protein